MQVSINTIPSTLLNDHTIVMKEGANVFVVEDENVEKVKTADSRTKKWIVETTDAIVMYIPKRELDVHAPRIVKNGYRIAIVELTYQTI